MFGSFILLTGLDIQSERKFFPEKRLCVLDLRLFLLIVSFAYLATKSSCASLASLLAVCRFVSLILVSFFVCPSL